ncbi:MAG: DUF2191 domain-containing protein [Verrucomicrobiota bacterium]
MKFTVDIPDDTLAQVQETVGEYKKGPAIVKALKDYLRRDALRDFGQEIADGVYDYDYTNEEVERWGMGYHESEPLAVAEPKTVEYKVTKRR